MPEQDRDYRFNDGRRYHGFQEEAYYLPNDETEVSRLGVFACHQGLQDADSFQISSMKYGA